MYFDAHNHLHDAALAPYRTAIMEALAKLPLGGAAVNGTSETDWPEVAALCRETSLPLRPSYGLHPWQVGNASTAWRDALRHRLDAEPGAGVGEIGLDRWMLERARPDEARLAGLRRASLEEQCAAFTWQLELGAARDLPVTIHCLDAWGRLASVVEASRLPQRGFLLHAYSGSAELAKRFIPLGAYFSFNGYFLAERHAAKREVFRHLPIERILVETDAPAMPLPENRRPHHLPGAADGATISHPANLIACYAGLAELRDTPLPALAASVAANFHRFFGV